MCLAIPARVVALPKPDVARIDLSGVQKEISLALVDDVRIGDYVIVHVGYALTKLDPREAELTLEMMGEAGLLDGTGTAAPSPGTSAAPAPDGEGAK
jgi:hydrogenase expression/formation protein HypC